MTIKEKIMRQHLGQAPDPELFRQTWDRADNSRSIFETSLSRLKEALAMAKDEAGVQNVFLSYQTAIVLPLEKAGLWATAEAAEKDMARVYALVNARVAAVNGFLGLPALTWLLIGAGAAAGWWFWKRSKGV
jgi:hypothetical protein